MRDDIQDFNNAEHFRKKLLIAGVLHTQFIQRYLKITADIKYQITDFIYFTKHNYKFNKNSFHEAQLSCLLM